MSLIPDRYRCVVCDGYEGPMFKGLSSRCKCSEPAEKKPLTEGKAA